MTDEIPPVKEEQSSQIALEVDLDAPVEKVWRALSIPEFRNAWLPVEDLAETEAIDIKPGEELSYRMREPSPPYLESTVTFAVSSNDNGGTTLRILHRLDVASMDDITTMAANTNSPLMMLAA